MNSHVLAEIISSLQLPERAEKFYCASPSSTACLVLCSKLKAWSTASDPELPHRFLKHSHFDTAPAHIYPPNLYPLFADHSVSPALTDSRTLLSCASPCLIFCSSPLGSPFCSSLGQEPLPSFPSEPTHGNRPPIASGGLRYLRSFRRGELVVRIRSLTSTHQHTRCVIASSHLILGPIERSFTLPSSSNQFFCSTNETPTST